MYIAYPYEITVGKVTLLLFWILARCSCWKQKPSPNLTMISFGFLETRCGEGTWHTSGTGKTLATAKILNEHKTADSDARDF